eukprot:2983973-Rhodomonas_salina.5
MSALVLSPRSAVRAVVTASLGALFLNLSAFIYRKIRIRVALRRTKQRKGNTLLFGELFEAFKHVGRFYDWKTSVLDEYGPTMACPPNVFMDGFVLSILPENVEHILATNFNNYIKPPRIIRSLSPVFGRSIFTLNHSHTADGGALWRLQRQNAVK